MYRDTFYCQDINSNSSGATSIIQLLREGL